MPAKSTQKTIADQLQVQSKVHTNFIGSETSLIPPISTIKTSNLAVGESQCLSRREFGLIQRAQERTTFS